MKRILDDIRRADADFDLIRRGERVAVGVSGGKDSLVLLRAMALYSRFDIKPFEVIAITLKTGDPFDTGRIRTLCEELDVSGVLLVSFELSGSLELSGCEDDEVSGSLLLSGSTV